MGAIIVRVVVLALLAVLATMVFRDRDRLRVRVAKLE